MQTTLTMVQVAVIFSAFFISIHGININAGGQALPGLLADDSSYSSKTGYTVRSYSNTGGRSVSEYSSTSFVFGRKSLIYTLQAETDKRFNLTLGFSEIYPPGGKEGFRIFDISVNDILIDSDVDVFARTGKFLFIPYTIETIAIPVNGLITIEIKPKVQNAMLSAIYLSEFVLRTPTPSPSPTRTPSPSVSLTSSPSMSSIPSASMALSPSVSTTRTLNLPMSEPGMSLRVSPSVPHISRTSISQVAISSSSPRITLTSSHPQIDGMNAMKSPVIISSKVFRSPRISMTITPSQTLTFDKSPNAEMLPAVFSTIASHSLSSVPSPSSTTTGIQSLYPLPSPTLTVFPPSSSFEAITGLTNSIGSTLTPLFSTSFNLSSSPLTKEMINMTSVTPLATHFEKPLPSPSTTESLLPSSSPSLSPSTSESLSAAPSPLRKGPPMIPSITWERELPNYPIKVFEAQGGLLGNETAEYIVIFGGIYRYPGHTAQSWQKRVDIPNQSWERLADMPEILTHMALWHDNQDICGAGGFIEPNPGMAVSHMFCLNRATNTWRSLPNLPENRAGGGLILTTDAVGKRQFIYSTGMDRETNSFAKQFDYGSTWSLDIDTPGATWQSGHPDIDMPRNHIGSVETCGRYFFVGGQFKTNEYTGNQARVDEWLPNERRWSKTPPAPLPFGFGHISSSVLPYNCGMIVIGGIANKRTIIDSVLYWEPIRNEWHLIGKYPHIVMTPICGIHGKKIYCATGGEYWDQDLMYIGSIVDVSLGS